METDSNSSVSEPQLVANWSVNCGHLFDDPTTSDVIIECYSQRLFVHKVILASNSDYFRALFYGGWKESHNDVLQIEDVDFKAFKRLLRCFYTNSVELDDFSFSGVLLIHELTNRFVTKQIEEYVSLFIKKQTTLRFVYSWYEAAVEVKSDRFRVQFMNYFEENFDNFLKDSNRKFLTKLPKEWILKIGQSNNLAVPEIKVFGAFKHYMEHNYMSEEDRKQIISCIRLGLIHKQHLVRKIRPSRLFTDTQILDGMEERLKYSLKQFCRKKETTEKVIAGEFEPYRDWETEAFRFHVIDW